MKIVQIGGALYGAQKIIEEEIHHRALEMGHESYIFYAWGKSDEPGIIRYENKFENLATRALRKYVGKRSCYSALQTRRLIQEIRCINPDIIHLHVLHHGYTDYQMLFKYLVKAQIPVVYTMHDMWAFTGGCYHFRSLNCLGFQTGCGNCQCSPSLLDTTLTNVTKSWQTKKELLEKVKNLNIVAVSAWVAEEVKRGFLAPFPISVIPNGVFQGNKDTLHPNCDLDEKLQIICVAASWTKEKGIDVLVELAELLFDEAELLLVGGVADEIRAETPHNIRFYGYCGDRKELLDLYRKATIHVSASLEETYGMTFVEAALAGTRSVGFASTAIEETLKGVYGVCVKEFTAHALRDAILTVKRDKKEKLSVKEIECVADKYSTTIMADKYLTLYEKIMRGRGGGSCLLEF